MALMTQCIAFLPGPELGDELKSGVMKLYETHLPVANTTVSERFYRDVLGLPLAHRDPSRDLVFLWADLRERGMLGLWGPGTAYGRVKGGFAPCHLAFAVTLDQLQRAGERLAALGIETQGFGGDPTRDPGVIGWMPSAQLYFQDPDGHLLEFISLLPEPPLADFMGTYSAWNTLNRFPR